MMSSLWWCRIFALALLLIAAPIAANANIVYIKCPPEAKWFAGWRLVIDTGSKQISNFHKSPMTNIDISRWDGEYILFSGDFAGKRLYLSINIKASTLTIGDGRYSLADAIAGGPLVEPCAVVAPFRQSDIEPSE